MQQRVSIVACWGCSGTGRARAEDAGDLRFEPCRVCAAHGRLRIIYGKDDNGDVVTIIEPQPDAPLPATPHLNKVKKRREARRAERPSADAE